MDARAEGVAQSLVAADLQRVVDRRRGVGTQPDDSPSGIETLGQGEGQPWIAVKSLEQGCSLGADIGYA